MPSLLVKLTQLCKWWRHLFHLTTTTLLCSGRCYDIDISTMNNNNCSLCTYSLPTQSQPSAAKQASSGRTFLRRGQGLVRFGVKAPLNNSTPAGSSGTQTPATAHGRQNTTQLAADSSVARSHSGMSKATPSSSTGHGVGFSSSVLSAVAESFSQDQGSRQLSSPVLSGASQPSSSTPSRSPASSRSMSQQHVLDAHKVSLLRKSPDTPDVVSLSARRTSCLWGVYMFISPDPIAFPWLAVDWATASTRSTIT